MSDSGLSLALDIGTRKVLGLVFKPLTAGIQLVASARREHRGRAMKDGQIHDVAAVAGIVGEVLAELSNKIQQPLSAAFVAAAGRSLITANGYAEYKDDSPTGKYVKFTAAMIQQLEWEAVAAAQAAAASRSAVTGTGYYCVGYSVTGQFLDGEPLSSLVGQIGARCELEVLATFLPRGVVDALEAVLSEVGLTLAGLTLEPIAALDAVVPPTTRHLDLALIDIGAGTSDIAVTSGGAVQGYAMVPQAGDAVTEYIAKTLLMDFALAEKAKRRAAKGQRVIVKDVLGRRQEFSRDDLLELTQPLLSKLADHIAQVVLDLNGKPPAAVLLVGGGSLTPGLSQSLAAAFSLPTDNVAILGREAVTGLRGGRLRGPDTVTPIGIALLAARSGGLPLIRVQVDDQWVRLFQPGRCTAGEALRAAGIPPTTIVGRPGVGITVTVNGEVRVFPGQRGTTGALYLNGQPADLDTICPDLGRLTWQPAQPGLPARPVVRQLLTANHWLPVVLDGKNIDVPPLIEINGRAATVDDNLADRDEVTIHRCTTVADITEVLALPVAAVAEEPAVINSRGRSVTVSLVGRLLVEGHIATAQTPVNPGANIRRQPEAMMLRDALTTAGIAIPVGVAVRVNGDEVVLEPPVVLLRNGEPATLDDLLTPADKVEVDVPTEWRPMLNEALLHAKDIENRGGDHLTLTVDGQPATFTTPLHPGAVVAAAWEWQPLNRPG